jgi:hypothetical protein
MFPRLTDFATQLEDSLLSEEKKVFEYMDSGKYGLEWHIKNAATKYSICIE